MVYRDIDYEGPDSRKEVNYKKGNDFFILEYVREQEQSKNMTEAEAEYNALLDELGLDFVGWSGTGIYFQEQFQVTKHRLGFFLQECVLG